MTPIILSGGSGTRLWPLSRKKYPKQFLSLFDDNLTLYQNTILRLEGIKNLSPPITICNKEHRFIVADQLADINHENQDILLEPTGKNTAPAIALAAFHLEAMGKSHELMLVLPADHIIKDKQAFHQSIAIAQQAAEDNYFVTFGIQPDKPETGYGYIKQGERLNNDTLLYKIDAFVEKPDIKTANKYLESKKYLWNAGIFLFKASQYLKELANYHPEIIEYCKEAYSKLTTDIGFIKIDQTAFDKTPSISVDVALMENTPNAVVTPLNAQWSDVGVWSAVYETGDKNNDKNVFHGDVLSHESHDNLVYTEKRLVSLVGVKDLVVVDTQDATLVIHKRKAQQVKQIVSQLEAAKRPEIDLHTEVHRPWGAYKCIDQGNRYQVKRLTLKPGACISSQMHHHRAEHWIVVKGTAQVKCNDKTLLLTENQSTYIPLGATHQLSNPGKIPLEIIEVQSGEYLGEDDIVRFEDQYGRLLDD